MCLALLALLGLYVGSILYLIRAEGNPQGPYTPVIKLNSPFYAPRAQKDLYIIAYLGGAVHPFSA